MFFDEVSLTLEGGQGGDGMLSFLREKFIAYGPPDGGDGGKGGSLSLLADANFNTFQHFSGRKHFTGGRGLNGHKNNRAGHAGEDLILKVPPGSIVFDAETNEMLADLKSHGDAYMVAEGGRGGYGNAHFVSSTRQAPSFAELGDYGEKKEIRLEMRLVADLGLLGFPSAGKSTFISHVTSAKPKIGAYPFTTLIPNLGVVDLHKFGGSKGQSFVIADMPGIIEGASDGKGLGDTFLKHISRSAELLFVLDPFPYEERSMPEQYAILKKELGAFDEKLLKKNFWVLVNKIDAIPQEDRDAMREELISAFPEIKERLRFASSASGEGLKALMFEIWTSIKGNMDEENMDDEAQIYEKEAVNESEHVKMTPLRFIDDSSFEVLDLGEIEADKFNEAVQGQFVSAQTRPSRRFFEIKGKRIEQISRMTNVTQKDAIERVYDVMKKMHIHAELLKNKAQNGDFVKIGPHVYEFHDMESL